MYLRIYIQLGDVGFLRHPQNDSCTNGTLHYQCEARNADVTTWEWFHNGSGDNTIRNLENVIEIYRDNGSLSITIKCIPDFNEYIIVCKAYNSSSNTTSISDPVSIITIASNNGEYNILLLMVIIPILQRPQTLQAVTVQLLPLQEFFQEAV